MNYAEAVRYLYSLGNEVQAAKLGLDRMNLLLDTLGDPHRAGNFIHVAGTNGKGSASAMIASTLRAAGHRTGFYSSPHLVEPVERIRIDGRPVAPDEFATAFDRVHAAAERLIAEGVLEAHPTYFETVTAMGFVLFREHAVKTAVLEVGLGGRLDATNVVLPRLAVITPIDFDHETFLGKGLDAIAAEKAGILKAGVPAVFASQRPEVVQKLAACAAALDIEPAWTSRWHVRDLHVYPNGSCFTAAAQGREIRVECPLAGEHQVENALTAATALDLLGFPAELITEGIRQTRWPGRLERVSAAPEILLDGAHNPAGARALAVYIGRFFRHRRVWLIYGAMRDKAVAEMAAILFPMADEVILTAPTQARAVRPETLLALADHPRARTAANVADALDLARGEATPDDVVFVSGSLFLVGEARKELVACSL